MLATAGTLMSTFLVGGAFYGPIAMVIAGIINGNTGKQARIDHARDYLGHFWLLIDEIGNAVLFLLMGFEMLVINKSGIVLGIGDMGIVVVLIARWISVALPVLNLRCWLPFERHAIALLTSIIPILLPTLPKTFSFYTKAGLHHSQIWIYFEPTRGCRRLTCKRATGPLVEVYPKPDKASKDEEQQIYFLEEMVQPADFARIVYYYNDIDLFIVDINLMTEEDD